MKDFFNIYLPDWLKPYLPIIVFILMVVAGILIRKYLFKIIKQITKRTETKIDDIIFDTIKKPFVIWFIIIGLDLALKTLTISEPAEILIDRISITLLILSLVLVFTRMTADLLKLYYEKRGSSFHTTSIIQNLIKIAFLLIGLLLILQTFGLSITPIITALGIGGLAVALALQDTLNNLFSGFYITISHQIRVGDFIRLENGSEGWVKDIGWRNTTLLLITNNYVIIPNSKLAQNIIINFSLPEHRAALKIPISVSYDSDPDMVEKVILDTVNKIVPEIPEILPDPKPSINLNPGFGDFALTFTLTVHIIEYSDPGPILGAIRKALFKRFKEEGIVIPYPNYTIHLKNQ
jgi:small-conductance mechanosensitive channel